MKHIIKILSLLILWCFLNSMISQNINIDPTGTYKLVSKITQKGADFYGYSGEIQVKVLSKNKIIMTFDVNKGAPTYNSGTFIDTLDYFNNKTIFKNPAADPSCEITFIFSNKGVTVKEKTKDFNCGCGFGHAVVADGFYSKKSAEIPVLKDPMTGEEIK
jgi:hypothetical protein